jgi:hypothetical protein
MRAEWQPVPLGEPESELLLPRERLKAACQVLGMAAVGLAIGCVMVLARRALGMDEKVSG